ncbi:Hypothetical protein AT6N2_L1264 [Agrobacterium tumefaciens]|uniref:cytochrome c oxidase assembly protein n=1 Tax=Agrobacterium tumefaciens TaxID=358 RepID=UPI001ADBC703|nr:cytochrome c oxidase assembly protein [Agrobacterium tumefaciens]QTK82057.1 Hypothetical protein AT6N2_L1264 [Agrobacterium tumefaciens]
MRALTLIIVVLASASPIAAHQGEEHASAATWTFDAWIVSPIILSAVLAGAGFLRLRRRSGKSREMTKSALAFYSGLLVLVAALVSPIHFMGEHLFTFHMIEHELVMAVAAPLIVLARPVGFILWSVPRRVRHLIAAGMTAKPVRASWNLLAGGAVATTLHGAAIWVWHAPDIFDATVTDVTLHRLQHLSFFLTAILFWWSVLWRSGKGVAAWHLFVTMMHTSILGALIALAPRVFYVSQTEAAPAWGLTPFEDQQLAGLLMWVPGGIIYAGAALMMMAAWISRSSKRGGYDSHAPAV